MDEGARTVRTVVFWLTLVGFLALLLLPLALLHAAPWPVDQPARWKSASLRPEKVIAADKAVWRYASSQERYQAVSRMRPNGPPAMVLFCLHYRESDCDFTCSAAQGDTLLHRSRNVPRGRIPDQEPPYTWEQCAEDAYYVCDRLDLARWNDPQSALDKMESFNGFGYRAHHIAAPYLWSGTTLYTRGKYTGDGRYSATALDAQLGCCAILKRMAERGLPLPF